MIANASVIGEANSQISSGNSILTPPKKDIIIRNGQTICYTQPKTELLPRWFAIRATQKRAQKVYESLKSLDDNRMDLYLPLVKQVRYSNDDFDNPTKNIVDVPVDPNLLFVRCTINTMLYYLYDDNRPQISGFTPYYNHCIVNSFGRNELLVVPDEQMESFRIIIESGNENIILNEQLEPEFLDGDTVVITGGPFAGVKGTLVKYKHQKRVFVQLEGIGCYGTSYVPAAWLRKV